MSNKNTENYNIDYKRNIQKLVNEKKTVLEISQKLNINEIKYTINSLPRIKNLYIKNYNLDDLIVNSVTLNDNVKSSIYEKLKFNLIKIFSKDIEVECKNDTHADSIGYDKNKDILQHLADGINPLSGEVFDDNHICKNQKVKKALLSAVKLLEKKQSKNINTLPKEYRDIKLTKIKDLPIDENIDIKCNIVYIDNKYTILEYLNKIYLVRTTKVSPPTNCSAYLIKKIPYGKEKQYAKLKYSFIEENYEKIK